MNNAVVSAENVAKEFSCMDRYEAVGVLTDYCLMPIKHLLRTITMSYFYKVLIFLRDGFKNLKLGLFIF